MKQKNLTGLRAGVYQESSKKSVLFDLLASALIFLALAAIGYTVSGFSATLWLLGAGILTCIAAAIIRHFQKTKLLLPILLAALLLVVLLARNPLLSGFSAAWNTLRGFWAEEKGILLPLAETDGSGLWLAGIVTGILLALLALAFSHVPTLAAAALTVLCVAAAFVQPGILLLAAAAIALLMLTWQKSKNAPNTGIESPRYNSASNAPSGYNSCMVCPSGVPVYTPDRISFISTSSFKS